MSKSKIEAVIEQKVWVLELIFSRQQIGKRNPGDAVFQCAPMFLKIGRIVVRDLNSSGMIRANWNSRLSLVEFERRANSDAESDAVGEANAINVSYSPLEAQKESSKKNRDKDNFEKVNFV